MASIAAPAGTTHARPTKVLYDQETSQKKRRAMFFEYQHRRRDEILDKMRHLEHGDGSSDHESDAQYDFLEVMRARKRRHEEIEIEEVDNDEEPEEEPYLPSITETQNDEVSSSLDTSQSTDPTPEAQENGDMEAETQEKKKKKRKRNRKKHMELPEEELEQAPKREAPIKPMLSEWLVEKPEDFEENWAGVLCPVGKRTILIASRKRTKVFGRKGEYYGHFQSMLPSGNYSCYKDGNRTRGITILDCIWSDTSQVFYVLDLICWNSHSCLNCDMDYRQFFLTSRFAENPELQDRNRYNRVPLILLPYFRALDFCQGLNQTLYPNFPEPVDGLLFYHREGFYIPETNPLCLWILLTQVHKRLGVDLPIELRSRQQPPSRRRPPRFKKETKITPGELKPVEEPFLQGPAST